MTNYDMPVLIGSVTALVLSLVWDRATTVGPVLFAWTGAATGGVVGFVRHYSPAYDQVDIASIIPWVAFGAACGLLLGFAVRAAYLRGGDRRRATLEAAAAAALCAGLGFVFGWSVHRRGDNAVLSAACYSGSSAAVGVALALANWRLRSKQAATAEPGAAADGRGRTGS